MQLCVISFLLVILPGWVHLTVPGEYDQKIDGSGLKAGICHSIPSATDGHPHKSWYYIYNIESPQILDFWTAKSWYHFLRGFHRKDFGTHFFESLFGRKNTILLLRLSRDVHWMSRAQNAYARFPQPHRNHQPLAPSLCANGLAPRCDRSCSSWVLGDLPSGYLT